MRKIMLMLSVGWVLVLSPTVVGARQIQFNAMQQLKARQKSEWKSLKSSQSAQKSGWRKMNIPRAQRIALKHQMARERRKLKEKQRDEREQMKDQTRMSKMYR